MNNFLVTIPSIIVGIVLLLIILLPMELSSTPDIKPGEEIAVLSGKTILIDGKPCQENTRGWVAFSGPEGELAWHKLPRLLWPTYRLISVIYHDGSVEWVPQDYIVRPDLDLDLCSPFQLLPDPAS